MEKDGHDYIARRIGGAKRSGVVHENSEIIEILSLIEEALICACACKEKLSEAISLYEMRQEAKSARHELLSEQYHNCLSEMVAFFDTASSDVQKLFSGTLPPRFIALDAADRVRLSFHIQISPPLAETNERALLDKKYSYWCDITAALEENILLFTRYNF